MQNKFNDILNYFKIIVVIGFGLLCFSIGLTLPLCLAFCLEKIFS